MRLHVVTAEAIAEHVKKLRLARLDGSPLPGFVAGAHVELALETPEGRRVRPYSLVSPPCDVSHYEIAVLRTDPSRGASRFLHESVRVGDALEVSAPRGAFRVVEHASRHTLIAGGIGVTPILAMAAHLRERGEDYRVHYSARSRARMAFADELEAVHGARATLYVDRDGGTTLDLARALGAPADTHHAYVCGPRSMIESVKEVARSLGWLPDHVHFESFGAPHGSSPGRPVVLRLLQSELTISVPPGRSLLDAMEEAGAWVNSECRRGECGKCTIGYTGGAIDHLDVCLTEEARRTQFCPCVSRPLSSALDVEA